MNRMPTSDEKFDRQLQQLQRQADAALSPATLARLREIRRNVGTAPASPWRRRGWWLATACSAVLAVTVAFQFSHAPPPASTPVMAGQAGDTTDDTLLFDQSPELYLWLGSDALAME